MASISLRKLRKVHPDGTVALRDLDLDVADGELVCLVGPSGCGKSTTLNLVAGLEEPTSGTVLLDGVDVGDRAPGERDLAMVFQSYALYPHLTVRGNLAFPLESARLPRAEIDARVRETAAMLGIDALLERRPRELSGGQRQRVALGRALVRRPKAFLFDEPLSNLDPGLRARTRGEIKKLHARLGATFLYVTHDQAEALTLADRVVVLDAGAARQVGTPREVYDAPGDRFVAEFFGAPTIRFVRPETLGLSAPETALAGVRPEHVEIGEGAAPSGPGVATGTVDLVEPAGADTWITLTTATGDAITGRAAAELRAAPGSPAWARVAPERVLQFDAATGRRLPGSRSG